MKKEKIIIKINLVFNADRKKYQRKRDIMHYDKEKKNKTKNLGNIL